MGGKALQNWRFGIAVRPLPLCRFAVIETPFQWKEI